MPRIAILLDSLSVPAWVYESIHQLLKEPQVEIVLAVVNQHPIPSGEKSPFLYRLYRAIDRRLFLQTPDAFQQKEIGTLPGWNVPVLSVLPFQKKFTDEFRPEDLEQIRTYQPDLIIRFGFRILKGKILSLAPWGVWSFHHGDPGLYRGGPPAFWEVIKEIHTTGCVLMRINEKLDQGEVLYQSHTQTDPLSVQRNANRIFWMSASFPLRVIREIMRQGKGKKELSTSQQPIQSPLWKNPRSGALIRGVGKLILRNLRRKLRERKFSAHWEIGTIAHLPVQNQVLSVDQISFFPNPESSKHYFADPFPFFYQGNQFIFAELYDKKKSKGRITLLDQQGNHQVILEEPWHLSYPFVFEDQGEIFLLPESAQAGKLWLYKAVDFPGTWERIQVIFPGEAYDPTLWKTEEGYWLFVNQKAHPACSPFDELYLYFSSSLLEPYWIAHPQNPIVSDVRKSRPAGRVFMEKGKLYRPAQDSEKRYGHRIRVMEIMQLSLESYKEEEAFCLEPQENEGILGSHTLNKMGDQWILDFYSRK